MVKKSVSMEKMVRILVTNIEDIKTYLDELFFIADDDDDEDGDEEGVDEEDDGDDGEEAEEEDEDDLGLESVYKENLDVSWYEKIIKF